MRSKSRDFHSLEEVLSNTKRDARGCMIWRGSFQGDYGRVKYNGEWWTVIRLVRFLLGDDINGLVACHRCDNAKCCNPDHIVMAPHVENMIDYSRKGSSKMIPPMPWSKVDNQIKEYWKDIFRNTP